MNKQLKILITNGKTQLFHSNFQIIDRLNIVEYKSSLYTVVDGKIPVGGSWTSIIKLVESGETISYVS